jgi:hypothetical protein
MQMFTSVQEVDGNCVEIRMENAFAEEDGCEVVGIWSIY